MRRCSDSGIVLKVSLAVSWTLWLDTHQSALDVCTFLPSKSQAVSWTLWLMTNQSSPGYGHFQPCKSKMIR
jgi:hypothetical protein